ncbi:hypothetical protein D0T49_05350 [Paludibacter sp. 221]|nr:hypothetical protein [Paludibacter sp. 221]
MAGVFTTVLISNNNSKDANIPYTVHNGAGEQISAPKMKKSQPLPSFKGSSEQRTEDMEATILKLEQRKPIFNSSEKATNIADITIPNNLNIKANDKTLNKNKSVASTSLSGGSGGSGAVLLLAQNNTSSANNGAQSYGLANRIGNLSIDESLSISNQAISGTIMPPAEKGVSSLNELPLNGNELFILLLFLAIYFVYNRKNKNQTKTSH